MFHLKGLDREAVSRALGSLRVRNYRLYFLGQAISSAGTWVQLVAEQWVVIRLGGGPVALGITTALQFVPLVVWGAHAGAVVDRANKRLLLTLTQSANGLIALMLGVLSLGGGLQVWMIWTAALLVGTVNCLDNAGRQALTRQMVGTDMVTNAVSLNTAIGNTARAVGPAIGGLLVAGTGYTACFLINAVSYGAVVVSLRAMRVTELNSNTATPRRPGQVREGFRYVRGRPALWVPILILATVSTFGMNYQVVVPLLVSTGFGLGPGYYGLLMSALGIGSTVGALVAASWNYPTSRRVGSLAILFGVASLGIALAPVYGIAVPLLALLGVAHGLFLSACVGCLQLNSADDMVGRVMALYYMAFLGVSTFSGPLVGGVAQLFGVRAAFVLAAITCVLAGALPLLRNARHRRQAPANENEEHASADFVQE